MVGEVPADMRDLHVVDVVVAQHFFGYLGAREAAGELHLRVSLEDGLQARLHEEPDDADGDDQNEHAGRGGRVACGGRFGVEVCLKQDDERLYHKSFVFLSVLAVRVVGPGLLCGHQYHIINVHVGR